MNPLVSVIVPCYKQAQYLSETLDSVLAQTYPYWECIIVNDGSPDDTEEIAKIYCAKDNRYKYVYQKNGGLASARNTGIHNSQGEFILPLDSDDLIGKEYLEQAMQHYGKHPSVKLIYCNAVKFGEENGLWNLPKYEYDNFIWNNCIFCSCIYRRSDYDKTSGYKTNMTYGFEDWDFLLSLLNPTDHVYKLEQTLFYYRIKKVSMYKSLSPNLEKALTQLELNHPDIYAKYWQETLWLKRQVAFYQSSLAYRLGCKILKPYRRIKQFFTHHYYAI